MLAAYALQLPAIFGQKCHSYMSEKTKLDRQGKGISFKISLGTLVLASVGSVQLQI